ncbi:MAG: 30S ribosomal protein S12 methylthiotransferase RimO [Ruminococcaceae bacterium]|nr:30S ribosomal protein S12 methylthiotransferase RimO [Oscillospiraceae bacterium]
MDRSKSKIGFVSLGCSKNLVDTERMLQLLAEAGYEIVAEDIEADVIIVNTCAFIESAKKESIESILDVAWLKEHRKLKGIIVTGCLAQRYGKDVMNELLEVDGVLGVGSWDKIVEAVDTVLGGEKYFDRADLSTADLGGGRILTTPFYTAYMKIAEGCDNCCTYCAIPMIRGKFRSRPMEDLIEEAKALEESGVKELNLIAQDTSRYGLDLYGEYKLAELIHAITEQTNIPWIRILYCYPDKITDDLVSEFKNNSRLVKYIDLPIQHISDPVLKRMNRHGTSLDIKDAIKRLRENVPGIVIRSTAIVGFPGETEQDFEELCHFIRDIKFDRFGAFPYSREEDTPAYDLPDQIDEQTKQDRYDIIMREQLSVVEKQNEEKVGDILTVLLEDYDPVSEMFFGRSTADAPDIDGKIYFTAPRKLPLGSFVRVQIDQVLDYDLVGRYVGKETV